MKLPIYLDYSATCPVDPRVAEKMVQYMTMDGTFGNTAFHNVIRSTKPQLSRVVVPWAWLCLCLKLTV